MALPVGLLYDMRTINSCVVNRAEQDLTSDDRARKGGPVPMDRPAPLSRRTGGYCFLSVKSLIRVVPFLIFRVVATGR